MRILLACAAFPPNGKGGGPAASELIAKELSALGHLVRVVTIADNEGFEVREKNIEVRTLSSVNIYWNYWVPNHFWKKAIWHVLENFNPRALIAIRRELKEIRPDIVVTMSIENINVATWLASYIEKIPVAHVIQSYFLMCWRGVMFKNGRNCTRGCFLCRISSIGKKVLSRCVDGVLADTRFPLEIHSNQGYFPNAIRRVVPGAVGLLSVPHKKPIDEKRLRIGYIGLHDPIKGIETLASAARDLFNRGTNVEFIVAGDGPEHYTLSLREKFPSSITRFIGWVDPSEFYSQVDVVVVPSLWREIFGRVSVEPLVFGVPVIAARSGGLPENVVDGESGYCFSSGDANDLARIIRSLAEDRDHYRHLSIGALNRAKHYDIDRVGKELSEFLKHICEHYNTSEAAQLEEDCQ